MYNGYFGFRESPFSVTPDPRFFYANPVYLEAFATLRYGIQDKKGFIVITGEVGTGKTTLLRKLLHNLEDTVHSVFIFNTYIGFPELLQLTLQDLGLAPKDKSKVTMLQELNAYLIKQLKQGHTVTMLIDEAQNLSDEVLENLRLLSNLETDQEKLIQIVLMGQPELQVKLAQPHLRQLKQRVALQCRISPLTDREVRPYIDSRLIAAGYGGKDLFHADAVERIAHYSNGIPRVMNIICDNALLNAYAASNQVVSADIIEVVARDLDLRSEPSVTEARDASTVLVPIAEDKNPLRRVPNELLQHQATPLMKASVGAVLVIFVLIAVASVIDSRELFSIAGRRLDSFRHNLNWVVPVSQSKPASEKPPAAVDAIPQNQYATIQPGSTIQKIAADTYGGPNTTLGMDLIKEFNPQIPNLNWVLPGQELLLPPLSQETLLREQPDGSYRFLVASFSNRADASAYARLLGNEGYQVTIAPNRVADDLLLQRVQIVGLKNLKEAIQTWDTGLAKEWFAFVSRPSSGNQLSKAHIAY
jgi:type II secretory pathway predicted ATPase ExeA